jgi:TPP-dependent pyruvate/acetoin dehydrogenase alpha subunit
VNETKSVSIGFSEKEIATILSDYRLACESREASLIGRKEVFMGKAKFGIFGDGKEVAQIAMAKVFRNGDFRAGYYRDQTFMFAIGELTLQQYFAQLYAHTSVEDDPASAGRLMNGHYATRMSDEEGAFKNLTQSKNSSADISPTAAQMPRSYFETTLNWVNLNRCQLMETKSHLARSATLLHPRACSLKP